MGSVLTNDRGKSDMLRGVGLENSRLVCLTGSFLDMVRYDFIDLCLCLVESCSCEDKKKSISRGSTRGLYIAHHDST